MCIDSCVEWITSLVHFTLYSRTYCHLCDDMLEALQAFAEEYAFTVDVVDIDLNEDLIVKYDELVPVLLGSKGGGPPMRLCHYFLDEAGLRAFLSSP